MTESFDDKIFKKVEYYKEIKPPTLNQFLVRKNMKEFTSSIKGVVGNVVDESTNRIIPKSSYEIKKLKGQTSEIVAEEHPEWVEEYYDKYGR